MVINKIRVTYLSTEDTMTLYLTEEQISYFQLNNINSAKIKFASVRLNLKAYKLSHRNGDSNRLYLSQDIKDRLYIPNGTVFQIRKTSKEELELGPLIGVFIDEKSFNSLISTEIPIEYSLFTVTCKKMHGMCCFFSMNSIDFNNYTVKGILKKNSKWMYITLPIPKVIYDQNHKLNSRANSIELRKRLGNEYVIINSMAKLSKWKTLSVLRKNPILIEHLPKTTKYTSSESLKDRLKDGSKLYIKPNSLSKGKGIFCITKKDNENFIVEYRTQERNHIVSLKNLEDLKSLLSKYKEIGQGYIIQEEIKKASFRGNPFDIRLLYQKNYSAAWRPSGMVARIAPNKSIITSPRSGGSVMDLPTVLREVFNEEPSDRNGLYENIINIGKEICISIENTLGDCVELGLDLAIDVNKKIWIIEVNGKPLKVSLKCLNNSNLVFDFCRCPIEYAVYLTGFKSFKPRESINLT